MTLHESMDVAIAKLQTEALNVTEAAALAVLEQWQRAGYKYPKREVKSKRGLGVHTNADMFNGI